MAPRRPPKENPLRVLFDYLDDRILGDPKLLAEMVRRQKRMLQTAYHPDSNVNGPFSKEEAEARSKAINASNELEWLTDALSTANGDKPEGYDGEAKDATKALNTWIEDYKRNRGSNGEQNQKYEAALKQVSSLMDQLRQSQTRIRNLEERLREPRAATSGPTRSGFTSTSPGAGTNISDKAKDYLSSAEVHATAGYGSDTERYTRMSEKIQQAKKAAQEQGINFDRMFGGELAEIVGRYVGNVLDSVSYYITSLNEERFTSKLDVAVKAATDFGQTGRVRPKIEERAREFINTAIERGKQAYSIDSATRQFDMAKRIGAKYGVIVSAPNR